MHFLYMSCSFIICHVSLKQFHLFIYYIILRSIH